MYNAHRVHKYRKHHKRELLEILTHIYNIYSVYKHPLQYIIGAIKSKENFIFYTRYLVLNGKKMNNYTPSLVKNGFYWVRSGGFALVFCMSAQFN